MTNIGWISRRPESMLLPVRLLGAASAIAVAVLVMSTGIAAAQVQTPGAPMPTLNPDPVVPSGYSIHQSVDLGGRMSGLDGSGPMYDTLVNLQTGPRMLGQTVEMHALPGNKHPLFDNLSGYSSGFGGDPNNFTKLAFSKGKLYDFNVLFRRDRQYFDYDLLGNPNITTGVSIAVSGSSTPLAWPQVQQSPLMFNTVRRMTDVNLTLLPLSVVTFRAAYSKNIFQGPSLTPGESVGKYNNLLSEYQRNGSDDFTGGVDWKPLQGTKITFEEQVDHYKGDSTFSLAPQSFLVQEANGTPASLGDWDSQTAYSTSACNTSLMANRTILLYANSSGGHPIIDPACDVATGYTRLQPTREIFPTEIFRFQSTTITNISMNGDIRYTDANMNLPNYYEQFQGLDYVAASGSTPAYYIRTITYTGAASAKREVMAADYGITWQAGKNFSVADAITYSNERQPGTSNISAGVEGIESSAASTDGNYGTINFNGPNVTGSATSTVEGSANGTPLPGYFGQSFLTNNLTGSWDVDQRTTVSLTWRMGTHTIGQGVPHNIPMAPAATNGYITINQDGGILNVAFRPTENWNLNGSVEMLYNDNAFTTMTPRQTKQYRVHTTYRPKTWATVSAAYTDRERHNNTDNNAALTSTFVPPTSTVAASGTPYVGQLDHVDHSRVASLGLDMAPSEKYAFDFNYAYSDVYTATNICYLNGSPTGTSSPSYSTSVPGAVPSANPTICPYTYGRGATAATEHSGAALEDWEARDFMDAPTQYVSAALNVTPNKVIHSDLGYRISDVNGSRFFNDARDVNGSLVSKYQSPYVSLAWTVRPGMIWKAEYDFYGYGEGGPSGSQYCSIATTSATNVTVGGNSVPNIVPCTSSELTGPTGVTEGSAGLTAARNFHANNVTLGLHYEF